MQIETIDQIRFLYTKIATDKKTCFHLKQIPNSMVQGLFYINTYMYVVTNVQKNSSVSNCAAQWLLDTIGPQL